ncbi:MAG TPA: hypothetical protein VIX84_17100 [Acidimicrobiales bacterium]
MSDVIVVIGAGQIGQAIARRIGAGKYVLLSDLRQENAEAAAVVFAEPDSTPRPRASTSPRAIPCTHSWRPPPRSAMSPA